jgi:hypothetical protein
MSQLESKNIPHMGWMIQDGALTLDIQQQRMVARWAVKTAMVLDSVEEHRRFYTNDECQLFKTHDRIPLATLVWLGRYSGNSLDGSGATVWFDVNIPHVQAALKGHIATILLGHLILQVLGIFTPPLYAGQKDFVLNPTRGTHFWNPLLVSIWPGNTRTIDWPPQASHDRSLYWELHNRWRKHP